MCTLDGEHTHGPLVACAPRNPAGSKGGIASVSVENPPASAGRIQTQFSLEFPCLRKRGFRPSQSRISTDTSTPRLQLSTGSLNAHRRYYLNDVKQDHYHARFPDRSIRHFPMKKKSLLSKLFPYLVHPSVLDNLTVVCHYS